MADPQHLEKLYRADKPDFKRHFRDLYPQLKGNVLAEFWHQRLYYEGDGFQGNNKDMVFVVIAAGVAGIIAKLPSILAIDPEYFYSRNIGFILFPLLAIYFSRKTRLSAGKATFLAGTMLTGLIFINVLPDMKQSDTLVLSCLHLVLFLWSLLGFAYTGDFRNVVYKRLNFLRYNGDLVVITTLMFLAGGILSGITIGLFSMIGVPVEKFYVENVVIFALPAVPIVGTYLTQSNPQLVGKISPLIAKIFSPLVLVMLVVYLLVLAFSNTDPFNDREFLIIFNLLLIGVMALIFFSVTEKSAKSQSEIWVLFLLSLVTVIVNGIALSAIMFRIAEWGLTPNRAAVLGGNIVMLMNLVLVTVQLYKVVRRTGDVKSVGNVIAFYLPVYFIWSIVVTFLFPMFFGF